ncbi:lipoprotein [Spiroplasma endosymbiont of Diplazon laetatorius]|uniref:lipoprotein n=1 Tax=Spiroplasma endosymbiont of Diplazon laetatorius TaxID=3066322 RepID=UPI0030CE9F42
MKKLLSILGAAAIVTPSIATVVSCGIDTTTVETLVNGDRKFKIDDKEVGLEKVFATNSTLSVLGYQILEAISFTENKYQNPDLKEIQKAVLGKAGQALSLDRLSNLEEAEKPVEGVSIKGDKAEEFWKDYNSTKNSRFTKMDFDFGFDDTTKAIKGDEKWKPSKASIFTADKAKTLEAKITYKDNKVEKTDYKEGTNGGTKTLQDFINENFNFKNSDLQKDYGNKGIYTLDSDTAKKLYSEINSKGEESDKEMIKDISETEFVNIHTALNRTNEYLKHGIVMPGKFDSNFTSTAPSTIVRKGKDDENKEEWHKQHKITDNKFFATEDDKYLQSQISGGSGNDNRTFVYGESDSALEINFTFTIPGNEKKNIKDKNYNIKVNLNNMIVGYQLTGAIIGVKKDENKKITSQTAVYWYQPTFYQFTDHEMFRISTSKDKNGTRDVFKSMGGATINISESTQQ